MKIEVCEMRPDDFEDVSALWKGNAKQEFPCGGDEGALAVFLARTRGLNLIAKEDETLLGVALCMKCDIGGGVCQVVIDTTKDTGNIAQILIGKAMQKYSAAVGKCKIEILNEDLSHEFWHASQWHFDPAVESKDETKIEQPPVNKNAVSEEAESEDVQEVESVVESVEDNSSSVVETAKSAAEAA